MALPTTISSSSFPGRNYYCGPFLSGGNVYVVLIGSANTTIEVFKATDPTSSFTAQDTANHPTNSTAFLAVWAYLSGTTIHIASHDQVSGNGNVRYHQFSTSSDTWIVAAESVETGIKALSFPNGYSVAISARSDNDRIVLYGGDPDTDMGVEFDRVDYARWEGSSWTAGIDVGGISPANESRDGASVVRGSGDNMHFFWHNITAGTLNGRTLDPSTNGLSTQQSTSQTLTNAIHLTNGVSYDDGGTQRITLPFRAVPSTAEVRVWRLTEDGSGDLSAVGVTTVNDSSTTAPHQIANSAIIGAALNSTTMHILWADSATSDLWRDSDVAPQSTSTWGTDTEFLDAVTINRISVNIYDRSGTKLAMVYDNAGTIQYNEIDLAVDAQWLMRRGSFGQDARLRR